MDREILTSLVREKKYEINSFKYNLSCYFCLKTADGKKLWYNAFEEDIAVANFFFSKPTILGKVILLAMHFCILKNKILQLILYIKIISTNTSYVIRLLISRIQEKCQNELA